MGSCPSEAPPALRCQPPSLSLQQASFHPDVSDEVRTRALRYGTECTLGYLDLLEHVLVVSSAWLGERGGGWGWAEGKSGQDLE